MATALIVAGHGSHISPNTAGLVWRLVDRLRAQNAADEITAAFWKEMPSFHHVLNTVMAEDVTIVPLFTANGYFTQTVIPAEMGLTGAITHHASDGRMIRYTPPLSDHPYLASVVRKRVESVIEAHALSAQEIAIAIIGHSTRRNPESRKATEYQARLIRESGLAAQVEAVYLDDTPEIAAIYTLTDAPTVIAVPYFLADGSHTTIDVPRELGLEAGATRGMVNGRTVFYTAPVGVDDDLLSVILALAHDAGMPSTPEWAGSSWEHFPSVGRDALIEAVIKAGVMRFGELRLSGEDVRVWGDDSDSEVIDTPEMLRVRVREAPFRSLATARDLPRGWHVPITERTQIHAVVETVYPGAVADWTAAQTGRLHINTLAETINRQTGMYRALERLTVEGQAQVVEQVCGGCVRQPLWWRPAVGVPCPEACNHWLSAALEILS